MIRQHNRIPTGWVLKVESFGSREVTSSGAEDGEVMPVQVDWMWNVNSALEDIFDNPVRPLLVTAIRACVGKECARN